MSAPMRLLESQNEVSRGPRARGEGKEERGGRERKGAQDVPAKLVVERPQHGRHAERAGADDRGDGDGVGAREALHVGRVGVAARDGLLELAGEDGRVDEHAHLEEAQDEERHDVLLVHAVEADPDLEDAVGDVASEVRRLLGRPRERESVCAHCEDEEPEVGRDALELRVAAEKVLCAQVARVLLEVGTGQARGGSGRVEGTHGLHDGVDECDHDQDDDGLDGDEGEKHKLSSGNRGRREVTRGE